MVNPQKRITVVSLRVVTPDGRVLQNGGEVIRTIRALAEIWVANRTHAFTSKKKFKAASERIVLSGK
jgi:hypothetical protein